MSIFCQITDCFNAKDFDHYIASCEVFIQKILIFVLPINGVNLVFVKESFMKVLHYVLYHCDFKVYLLANELDDVAKSSFLFVPTLLAELVVLAVMQTHLKNLSFKFVIALLYQFTVSQDQLLEVAVDPIEFFELIELDSL